MKTLVITTVIVSITAGIGVYFLGGLTVLGLSVLIPLFIIPFALLLFGSVMYLITGPILKNVLAMGHDFIQEMEHRVNTNHVA